MDATQNGPRLRTWRTITLGLHKSGDKYRNAMKSAGNKVGNWADIMLGKAEFSCASDDVNLDLVTLSVAELGFKDRARYSDISARAAQLPLDLCPAEVGPALRLTYNDQPPGEWLLIAMSAIAERDDPSIFSVDGSYRGLLQGSRCGSRNPHCGAPERFWHLDDRFVFVRPN